MLATNSVKLMRMGHMFINRHGQDDWTLSDLRGRRRLATAKEQ
jgi:hypothetical protein